MVYKHAVVAAFRIYAQHGEDAAKRESWIVMEITLLIMENHGKIMELSFWISVGTLPEPSMFVNQKSSVFKSFVCSLYFWRIFFFQNILVVKWLGQNLLDY